MPDLPEAATLEKIMDPLGLRQCSGIIDRKQKGESAGDYIAFNIAVTATWPLFSLFLLSQPWLSNWANNEWHAYSANYTVYSDTGQMQGTYRRSGLCTTPAEEMHCTDGQNFTELALKYRGVAYGCGCGQGVLGEGLCPMTSYGHTLSDFVSTGPGISAMLGLGFFPLVGTWRTTMLINEKSHASKWLSALHVGSMMVFQLSYIMWGIASACIFPVSHSVLTVVFLGSFLVHWKLTALICLVAWGVESPEAIVTFVLTCFSICVMLLGSIPRIFLTLNDAIGQAYFPNWNRGLGSYAFWFAEAVGLSATFGAYPIMLIVFSHPRFDAERPVQFQLWPGQATAASKQD